MNRGDGVQAPKRKVKQEVEDPQIDSSFLKQRLAEAELKYNEEHRLRLQLEQKPVVKMETGTQDFKLQQKVHELEEQITGLKSDCDREREARTMAETIGAYMKTRVDALEEQNNKILKQVAYFDTRRNAFVDDVRLQVQQIRQSGHPEDAAQHMLLKAIGVEEFGRNNECVLGQLWNELGISFHTTKKYDQSVSAHTKAIEFSPRDVVFYHNRAVSFDWMGKRDDAIKDLKSALKIDPSCEMVKQKLAQFEIK